MAEQTADQIRKGYGPDEIGEDEADHRRHYAAFPRMTTRSGLPVNPHAARKPLWRYRT